MHEGRLWPALRQYWHAVVASENVQATPVPVALLGERLVLVRLAGRLACFRDLCIHRGTPLSLGWIDGGDLVCAYHGWRYDANGACTRIPAIGPSREIPRRARVDAYAVEERYGLVWVCLESPRAPIPEFPEYDDDRCVRFRLPPLTWKASAARCIENFTDMAHFAWVHPGLLGDRRHAETPLLEPRRAGEELQWAWHSPADAQIDAFAHAGTVMRFYRLFRPFSIHVRQWTEAQDRVQALFYTSCPRSANENTAHLIIARNFATDEAETQRRLEFNMTVMAQDQRIVESQRPQELPLDLRAELHIKGPDEVAVEYRKFMAELGVETN
jgi:vanillate O-demethylase monooxygenase subunit